MDFNHRNSPHQSHVADPPRNPVAIEAETLTHAFETLVASKAGLDDILTAAVALKAFRDGHPEMANV